MGVTVILGDFEWDEEKAASNERKHGVSFEVATAVFLDTRASSRLTILAARCASRFLE
jgi:uncharacterized DUF497 family protein